MDELETIRWDDGESLPIQPLFHRHGDEIVRFEATSSSKPDGKSIEFDCPKCGETWTFTMPRPTAR